MEQFTRNVFDAFNFSIDLAGFPSAEMTQSAGFL